MIYKSLRTLAHMRTYRRIVVAFMLVVFVTAGLEYQYYKMRSSDVPNKRVVVYVKTTKTENGRVVAKIVQDKAPKELKVSKKKIADTPNENGPVVPNIVEDKPVKEPEIRKEKIVDTAKEKKVVPLTTTQDSIDVEAERDSGKRKKSVDRVCKRLDAVDVLEQPADRGDKKKKLQRFNLLHHIIVNEKHKVLYCFIPKVGCSNLKRIFLVMDGLYPSVEKVDVSQLNRAIVRLDSKKFSEEQRKHMLKNFYKFMLVRDPFERLVSGYRNKWQDKRNIELHLHLGKRIVEKYRYNNTKTVETGNDVTFTEYVRYLTDNPPWDINEHWMPYEDLCRPCNVKYDFIGSIDTLERDVKHVMRQIHANETKYHLVRMRGAPLVKAKGSAAEFLRQLPRKYFDKLLKMFKADHELFNYRLPDFESLDKRYTV